MFRNFHIKFLALLAAVIFWGIIVTTENTYFMMPEKIVPQVFNVDEGLAVAGEIEPVAITVRTSSDTFRQLTTADFKVSIDLQGATTGEQIVPVTITTKKTDVSIVSIEPTQVSVQLEKMEEVTQRVSLTVNGTPAQGYAAGDIESLAPTVTVNGAQSLVTKVTSVEGTITMSGTETTNFVSHLILAAVDSQGNALAVTVTPAEIDVIVPILQVVDSKTVGIKANIQNTLDGTFVESVEIDPDVISITGDPALLKDITYVETIPIAPQTTGLNSTTVALDLPEGVTLVANEPSQVRVTVTIASLDQNP